MGGGGGVRTSEILQGNKEAKGGEEEGECMMSENIFWCRGRKRT